MASKKPILLLIRRIIDGKPAWLLESAHATDADAERRYNRAIRGMGITAWAWWGPRATAEKMLADSSFDPDNEQPASSSAVDPIAADPGTLTPRDVESSSVEPQEPEAVPLDADVPESLVPIPTEQES